jgi:hypothetical protein
MRISFRRCRRPRRPVNDDRKGLTQPCKTIGPSDKFEMPLRSREKEGHITELRNINIKEPPAGLFQPMEGYRKVDNPMAIMGMDAP